MKWLHKLDSLRRRYCKEEFAIIIMLLLMFTLIFPKPKVIGYASTNIHTHNTDLLLDSSKEFYMESIYQNPVHLTSLRISGEVIGSGTVNVNLDDGQGGRVLVFTNQKRTDSQINKITGGSFFESGSLNSGMGLSGLSVTGDALPLKTEEPVLELTESHSLQGFSKLEKNNVAHSGKFSNVCFESCILPEGFIQKMFKLDFYIEPGTRLKVTELVYTTVPTK